MRQDSMVEAFALNLFSTSRIPWPFRPRKKQSRKNKLFEPEGREYRGLLALGSLFENRIKILMFFLGFLLVAFYSLMLSQYFQQDEWHSFGIIQSYGFDYVSLDKPFWELVFTDRVGARFIMFVLFSLFGASPLPFALFAVIVHTLNSLLVFLLARQLTKSMMLSFVASFFFFFNSLGHQAYSWFGTVAGSATSVTFILLSVLFYFKFLKGKRSQNLLISLLCIWLAFLFKESGYFVFILYPLAWFIYKGSRSVKDFLHENWLILIYGTLMTFLLAKNVLSIPGEKANYISASSSGLVKLSQHLFFYPLEGIGQSFIPLQLVFGFSRMLTQLFVPDLIPETSEFDAFYTVEVAEGLALTLSFIVIGGLIFVYKKFLVTECKLIRSFAIFSLLFLTLSFLPYVVLDKFDAYLDSRYYYMGLVGGSYLFSVIVITLLRRLKGDLNKKILIGAVFLVFLSHVVFLATDLVSLARVSSERKLIINQILAFYPRLGKKTVFYITGDSPGYYGIPELKVPFQSGLGQVLMTIYGEKGQVDSELFKEKTLSGTLDAGFLYDTLGQGYKEIEGRGFGYYYDKDLLAQELKADKFTEEDIKSLFYGSDSRKIQKISFN